MPLREIEEKFSKSELVILAWRSQEMHHNMMQDNPLPKKNKKGKIKQVYGPDDIGPEGMPTEFFDENGEINLSQVTGEEARRYFELRLGIPLPTGVSKIQDESESGIAIRKAYSKKPKQGR